LIPDRQRERVADHAVLGDVEHPQEAGDRRQGGGNQADSVLSALLGDRLERLAGDPVDRGDLLSLGQVDAGE
jgi:hypothetical protein